MATILAGALLLSLAAAASTCAAPSEWSITHEANWTEAKVFRYMFVKAHTGAIRTPAHFFGVWTPRDKPPEGRARATLTRSFKKLEGDTVTLSFFGDPVEKGLHPQASVALYVRCHILAPGQAEPGAPPEWVKIGRTAVVKPSFVPQTLKAKIEGGACTGPVAIGHTREVTGARIQLLGATNKSDQNHREIYLTRFEIDNGGMQELLEDFTHA